MYIFKLLLLLTIITSCNNSGGGRMPTTQQSDVNNEFHPYLKEGVYQVDYYASREVSLEHKKLIKKLSKLIETNSETQNYFSKVEEGELPKYKPDIGISREEYNQLTDLFAYKVPKESRGTLKILKEGNRLSFKGDKKLFLLDSLILTISNKTASYKMYEMNQKKQTLDLSNEDFPKGDSLESYEYYKGPEGLLGMTGLEGAYELLIGKLKPSGKIYLSFYTKQPDIVEHPIPEFITIIIDK